MHKLIPLAAPGLAFALLGVACSSSSDGSTTATTGGGNPAKGCETGLLPDQPLTVITHALSIAGDLASRRQIRTIVIGGLIDPESFSLVGPLATQCLDAYHVDKLFLSCQGIDLQRGLSVASEQQADLKRRMLADADQRILLADHSKFGVRSTCYFGALEDIDRVLTDDGADENLLAELRQKHVEVQVVKRG